MAIRKTTLLASAASLAALGWGQAALAQDDDAGEADVIVVTGIRGSVAQSIDTKRFAPAVVDVAHEPRRRTDVACEDLVDGVGHGVLNRCSGPAGE